NIINAQTKEIDMMRGWLKDWYKVDYKSVSMNTAGDHSGMNMDMADPAGMMGMLAGLSKLKGIEYDTGWLDSMIDHHDDALHMANRVLKTAQHAELRAFAVKIIADQSAEIIMMGSLIAELNAK